MLHVGHRDRGVRRDDARKFLDAGVEIADAQHFPRMPTR
jgi:hypothetical protein